MGVCCVCGAMRCVCSFSAHAGSADNYIGDDGAVSLAASLKDNSVLVVMDVGANRICAPGASAFADMLRGNVSARELNLECLWAGARASPASGRVNRSEVARAGNNVGDTGATAFADSLSGRTSLMELSLAGTLRCTACAVIVVW